MLILNLILLIKLDCYKTGSWLYKIKPYYMNVKPVPLGFGWVRFRKHLIRRTPLDINYYRIRFIGSIYIKN